MKFADRIAEWKRPASCRDKGWDGVDVGALCLSSLDYDHCACRNPDESCCEEDKHKAPTQPRIHPLSLQDGADGFSHSPIWLSNIIRTGTVILSAAKDLRLCEMRSRAFKMTEQKWLHRPNDISFHTVSLRPAWREILRSAQDDSRAGRASLCGDGTY